mmetsp:Transcript_37098/g.106586  ORF Transcript_37098/g.106586 Transcript_37098/m.106586 type:complete len:230 (-) Transcript_37098:171-860(-)
MVATAICSVVVPRLVEHLLEQCRRRLTHLLGVATLESVRMVDQASCVVGHEEEVCLVGIVRAARARQEPIVQCDFHAPLVVLTERRPPGQLLECWMLVGLIHVDPKARFRRAGVRGAEAAGAHGRGRRTVGSPVPHRAPISIVQPEGVLEAPSTVRPTAAASHGSPQDLPPQAVHLRGGDGPDGAVPRRLVEKVRVQGARLAIHQPEGMRRGLNATHLLQQKLREEILQ